MIKILQTIEKTSKIFFGLIFVLAFSSALIVNAEGNGVDTDADSLYRYNALENKASYVELTEIAQTAEITKEAAGDEVQNEIQPEDRIIENLADLKEKENFSVSQIDQAMSSLGKQSGVETLLVGNNLATLRFQSAQLREQTKMLDRLAKETGSDQTRIQIDTELQFLAQEQTKVEDFIRSQKNEFSLFGWFVNLL